MSIATGGALPPIAIVLTSDTSDANADLAKTEHQLEAVNAAATRAGKAAGASAAKYAAVGVLALQAARGVLSFVKSSVAAAQESAVNDKRLETVARSMGLVNGVYAGVTQRVKDYAAALMQKIGVDDDDIKMVQAKLMTFKNLTVTINENGGAFDRATKAAYDLAATGFGQASSNAVQLGKALQDPIKGITALARAGVTFTAAQKEQIKAFVDSGKMAAAQNLVLSAIEKQVGGVAAATVTGTQRMKVAWGEFKEGVGRALLDALNNVGDKVGAVLGLIGPYVAQAAAALATIAPYLLAIAAAALVAYGAYRTLSFATGIMNAIQKATYLVKLEQIQLNLAILANPYVLIAAGIVAAVAAVVIVFKLVYDRSEALRKTWSELVNTVKQVVSVLVGSLVNAWKQITGQTDDAGKKSKGFSDVLKGVADFLANVFTGYLKVVTVYITVLSNVLQIVIKWFQILINVGKILASIIVGAVIVAFKTLVGILDWVLDHLGPVGDYIRAIGKSLGDTFAKLPDIVSSAFRSVVGWIESGVNKAIDLLNGLIDKFNELPAPLRAFQSIDSHIEHVTLGGFSGANDMWQAVADAAPAKTTPTPTGGGPNSYDGPGADASKASKAAAAAKKALDEVKKLMGEVKDRITAAAKSYIEIRDATAQKFGEPSSIMKAFGSAGDVGSAISAYDQLDASLRDYYVALQHLPNTSKAVSAALQNESDAQRAALKTMTESQIRIMQARADIAKQLTDLDTAYSKQQDTINKQYDALDKAAEANAKAIADRYDKLIPQLEAASTAANAAFDKENNLLQGLVQARDQFLSQLQSGVTAFVNNATADNGSSWVDSLRSRLATTKDFIAQIKTLVARGLDSSLAADFASKGAASAGAAVAELTGISDDALANVNDMQKDLAATVSDFTTTASKQWFDAGIAQQQAIVGPLKAAAEAAASALDAANTARAADLASSAAYIEELKTQRAAALEQAKADYEAQKLALETKGKEIDASLDANAKHINAVFADMALTLPPALTKAGMDAVDGLIAGLNDKGKNAALLKAARGLGATVEAGIRDALETHSPSRVSQRIMLDVVAGLVNTARDSEATVARSARALGRSAVPDPAAGVSGALDAGFAGLSQSIANGGNTYSAVVHSQTNADPHEIADEVAWGLRTAGVMG